MKLSVFIHTNKNQMLGAFLSKYAFHKNSRHTDKFDVQIIEYDDYPDLKSRDGMPYLRAGRPQVWRNNDIQCFTPLRFMPPDLMNYEGRAVVVDPDVFAIRDVHELLTRDMGGKAIMARHILPKDGLPTDWATSVMLLDCAKLTHWHWSRSIEEMFTMKRDYLDWMRLRNEDQDTIGLLEDEWNSFDVLTHETRMLHNTEKTTQPWKTGLEYYYTKQRMVGYKWGVIPRPFYHKVKEVLGLERTKPIRYRRHPDPDQERFFFSTLNAALRDGAVSEDFLRSEVANGNLRPDLMERLG